MSPFNVGFVIFPELTQLDFTGPQQVLARLPQSAMHIIAKTTEPVPSDSGLSLVPTHTFENSPRLDLICIPGGNRGVVQALGDRETIDFVSAMSGCGHLHRANRRHRGAGERQADLDYELDR